MINVINNSNKISYDAEPESQFVVPIIVADLDAEPSGWGLARFRDRLCLLTGDSSSFLFLQSKIKLHV